MVSCSHWGLFQSSYAVTAPAGYRFPSASEVQEELTRRDGMIRMVKLRRRPFLIRLRNHYRAYRRMSLGLSRWGALKAAWSLATV